MIPSVGGDKPSSVRVSQTLGGDEDWDGLILGIGLRGAVALFLVIVVGAFLRFFPIVSVTIRLIYCEGSINRTGCFLNDPLKFLLKLL